MNKIVVLTIFRMLVVGMLGAIIVLQLEILGEIKKPKTFQISAAPQAAAQPTLVDLKKQHAAIETRYLILKNMTQEEWNEEGKQLGGNARLRAPSLEAAREQNKKWLDELEQKIKKLSK